MGAEDAAERTFTTPEEAIEAAFATPRYGFRARLWLRSWGVPGSASACCASCCACFSVPLCFQVQLRGHVALADRLAASLVSS